MKSFSLEQYQKLLDTGTVLEEDGHGVKVVQTDDGRIVKFFRLKRMLSSAVLKSYAARFIDNAKSLEGHGVRTVQILDRYYCRELKRTLVVYQPLPGKTLRDAVRSGNNVDKLVPLLARFVAELHGKGILFRSLHFGNIIVVEPGDEMGLIDVADMKIKASSLSVHERVRNFQHMLRYDEDQAALKRYGVKRFLDAYMQSTRLDDTVSKRFLSALQKQVPFFGGVQSF